jgi:hypothetical protein
MVEAMLEIFVIVLVGLWVDDDRVIDARLGDELAIFLEVADVWVVRRVRVQRPAIAISREHVDVGVNQQALWTRRGC